jgi:Flp pilus assembly protein TadD
MNGAETTHRLSLPDTLWRGLLTLALLVCVALATTQAIAQHFARQRTAAGFRQAVRWDPWDASFHSALARYYHFSLDEADPAEVIRLREAAVRRAPFRAELWVELGNAYEQVSRQKESQRAFERALQLFPNSPELNWKFGNFYLRAGRVPEALRSFRRAFQGSREYRRPVVDLAWRATENVDLILAEAVPPSAENYFLFLNYLLEASEWDAAEKIWDRLVQARADFDLRAAFPFLDALIRNRRIDRLESAWRYLMEKSPGRIRMMPREESLIVNGDFEGELVNGGLDWRFAPTPGVRVTLDNLTFFDGTNSVRFEFDGSQNFNYSNMTQFVPVQPGRTYRFTAYQRAREITTDSGPRFQIYDAYDSSRLNLLAEPSLGTTGWEPRLMEFRAGPHTRLLVVRVVRLPSSKFDNKLSGTFWVDRVQLRAID